MFLQIYLQQYSQMLNICSRRFLCFPYRKESIIVLGPKLLKLESTYIFGAYLIFQKLSTQ